MNVYRKNQSEQNQSNGLNQSKSDCPPSHQFCMGNHEFHTFPITWKQPCPEITTTKITSIKEDLRELKKNVIVTKLNHVGNLGRLKYNPIKIKPHMHQRATFNQVALWPKAQIIYAVSEDTYPDHRVEHFFTKKLELENIYGISKPNQRRDAVDLSTERSMRYKYDTDLAFEDPYNPILAELKYLKSNPTCYIVFGKITIDISKLGHMLARYWGCEFIDPLTLINNAYKRKLEGVGPYELPGAHISETGSFINYTVDNVWPLLEEKLRSDRVAHSGYVISGFPMIPDPENENSISIQEQINKIFNMDMRPDVIIYSVCPDLDATAMRSLTRFDIRTGYTFNVEIYNRGQHINDLNKKNGYLPSDILGDSLLKEYIVDKTVLEKSDPHMYVQCPGDNEDNVTLELELYNKSVLPEIDRQVLQTDPQFVIRVDGRTPIVHQFQVARARLDILPLQRNCKVSEHVLFVDEKKDDEDDVVDAEIKQPPNILEPMSLANPSESESDPLGQINKLWTSNFSEDILDSAFKKLSELDCVGPKFRWHLSAWVFRCPVMLAEGMSIRGDPKLAVRFLDNIFFLSSEEAKVKFLENPKCYIRPPNPICPCRIFVIGPPNSGKTFVSKVIGSYFGATVLLYDRIFDDCLKNKREQFVKSAIELAKTNKLKELMDYYDEKSCIERVVWSANMLSLIKEHLSREPIPQMEAPEYDKENHEDPPLLLIHQNQTFFPSKGSPSVERTDLPVKKSEELGPPKEASGTKLTNASNASLDKELPQIMSILDYNLTTEIELRNLFDENGLDFYDDLIKCNEIAYEKPEKLIQDYLPQKFSLKPNFTDHPDVEMAAKIAEFAAYETKITLSAPEIINMLRSAVQIAEAETRLTTSRNYGGWVIDNPPTDTVVWASLRKSGLLPDEVIELRDLRPNRSNLELFNKDHMPIDISKEVEYYAKSKNENWTHTCKVLPTDRNQEDLYQTDSLHDNKTNVQTLFLNIDKSSLNSAISSIAASSVFLREQEITHNIEPSFEEESVTLCNTLDLDTEDQTKLLREFYDDALTPGELMSSYVPSFTEPRDRSVACLNKIPPSVSPLEEFSESMYSLLSFGNPTELCSYFQPHSEFTMYVQLVPTNVSNSIPSPQIDITARVREFENISDQLKKKYLNETKFFVINFNQAYQELVKCVLDKIMDNYKPSARRYLKEEFKQVTVVNNLSYQYEENLEEEEEQEGEFNNREDGTEKLVKNESKEENRFGDTYIYCPVEFKDKGDLILGRKEFACVFIGRVYYMSSEETYQQFMNQPASYAPLDNPPTNFKPVRVCVTGPIGHNGDHIAKILSTKFGFYYVDILNDLNRRLVQDGQTLIGVVNDEPNENEEAPINVNNQLNEVADDFVIAVRNYLNECTAIPNQYLKQLTAPYLECLPYKNENTLYIRFPRLKDDLNYLLEAKILPVTIIQVQGSNTKAVKSFSRIVAKEWALNRRKQNEKLFFLDLHKTISWKKEITDLFTDILNNEKKKVISEHSNLISGDIVIKKPECIKAETNINEDDKMSESARNIGKRLEFTRKSMSFLEDIPEIQDGIQSSDQLLHDYDNQNSELLKKGQQDALNAMIAFQKDLENSKGHTKIDRQIILHYGIKKTDIELGLLRKIDQTVRKTLPRPVLLVKNVGTQWKDKNPASAVWKVMKVELESLLDLKELATQNNIPWLTCYNSKQQIMLLTEKLNAIVKREPHMFETTYEISEEEAHKLLHEGYFFLSKFGFWCPVQVVEKTNPIQMYFKLKTPYNDVYPVVHRRYIYFLFGKLSRDKFRTNPLQYTSKDPYAPIIPMKIAIIGPPKSGKTSLAMRFADEYGLEIVTVSKAVSYIGDELPWTTLSSLMKDGVHNTFLNAVRSLDAYLLSTKATTQGWVFDGFPTDERELDILKAFSIVPHVIFYLDASLDDCQCRAAKGALFLTSQHEMFPQKYKQWIMDKSLKNALNWLDYSWGNVELIPAKYAIRLVYETAKKVAMDVEWSIQKYFKQINKEDPACLAHMCVSPVDWALRESYFHDYCPPCLTINNCLNRVEYFDRAHLLQYLDHYYWFCPQHFSEYYNNAIHLKKVVENEEEWFYEKPEILKLTEVEVKQHGNKVQQNGLCVVCYSEKPWSRDYHLGDGEYAIRINDKVYLLCGEQCMMRMIFKPRRYKDTIINFQGSNKDFDWFTLKSELILKIPEMSYLDQTTSQILIQGLYKLALARPHIPGVRHEIACFVYLGYFFKCHLKRLSPQVRRMYLDNFKKFKNKYEAVKNILISMRFHPNPSQLRLWLVEKVDIDQRWASMMYPLTDENLTSDTDVITAIRDPSSARAIKEDPLTYAESLRYRQDLDVVPDTKIYEKGILNGNTNNKKESSDTSLEILPSITDLPKIAQASETKQESAFPISSAIVSSNAVMTKEKINACFRKPSVQPPIWMVRELIRLKSLQDPSRLFLEFAEVSPKHLSQDDYFSDKISVFDIICTPMYRIIQKTSMCTLKITGVSFKFGYLPNEIRSEGFSTTELSPFSSTSTIFKTFSEPPSKWPSIISADSNKVMFLGSHSQYDLHRSPSSTDVLQIVKAANTDLTVQSVSPPAPDVPTSDYEERADYKTASSHSNI